ncbi:MAG: glycosyltransferase [Phycisphaera sp.]|nr:glycosyltransferase [Phycisphaera sp.]
MADYRKSRGEPLLVETAWEVVNPVGGIYTVIRSKLAAMGEKWGRRYLLVGPWMPQVAAVEFQEARPPQYLAPVLDALKSIGIIGHYGRWLVVGRPNVLLFEMDGGRSHLDAARWNLWEHHKIPVPTGDAMINDVVAFGYMLERFLDELAKRETRPVIAHFHEWMAGSAIPELRRLNVPITTVFTTHATLLGRYIAASDVWYYDHVPFIDWAKDAARFNIEPQVRIERAAAHGAHVLTTVSNITGFECEHILGRKVDVVTPNGLNIERFTALHEFQNLHRRYKEKIHEFVMGHFFPSGAFNLDRTLYFFTSGRYEYRNKGYDLTIEALARLNHRLKHAGTDRTVVAFLITKQPTRGLNAEALRTRAVMDELRQVCDAIKDQVGERLFFATAEGNVPRIDTLVDDYWKLRLRRTLQAWKTGRWPGVITHDLLDEANDEVLNKLRECRLFNNPDDPVKIVYHPDFIAATNPLWGIDYDQFVRGCHLGIFPSFYEPWGYTPLECIARGIPTVTSDVSGFGSYVLQNVAEPEQSGIHVLRRRYTGFDKTAAHLAEYLFRFCQPERRDRIEMRYKVDRASEQFDWSNLVRFYDASYELALSRA